MKLYEISESYRNFMAAVEAGEIPDEAIDDTLDALEGAFADKAEAVACMVKEYRAEADAIKKEKDALAERQQAKDNRADWLENYLYRQMKSFGMDKFETSKAKVKFTKGEKVAIDDETTFVAWAKENADDLLTFKEPSINRTAVKGAIKGGKELPGVMLEKTERARVG